MRGRSGQPVALWSNTIGIITGSFFARGCCGGLSGSVPASWRRTPQPPPLRELGQRKLRVGRLQHTDDARGGLSHVQKYCFGNLPRAFEGLRTVAEINSTEHDDDLAAIPDR